MNNRKEWDLRAEIKEKQRIIRSHEDKIRVAEMHIRTNRFKISQLEQKLKEAKGFKKNGKFHPTDGDKKDNQNEIYLNASKKEILDKIKDFGGFQNISDDGWFSGYIYLDDGEGMSGDARYRVKADDNKILVEMNKNDIPRHWQDQRDDLLEEATQKVYAATGFDN